MAGVSVADHRMQRLRHLVTAEELSRMEQHPFTNLWQPQEEPCQLIPVAPESQEYQMVQSRLDSVAYQSRHGYDKSNGLCLIFMDIRHSLSLNFRTFKIYECGSAFFPERFSKLCLSNAFKIPNFGPITTRTVSSNSLRALRFRMDCFGMALAIPLLNRFISAQDLTRTLLALVSDFSSRLSYVLAPVCFYVFLCRVFPAGGCIWFAVHSTYSMTGYGYQLQGRGTSTLMLSMVAVGNPDHVRFIRNNEILNVFENAATYPGYLVEFRPARHGLGHGAPFPGAHEGPIPWNAQFPAPTVGPAAVLVHDASATAAATAPTAAPIAAAAAATVPAAVAVTTTAVTMSDTFAVGTLPLPFDVKGWRPVTVDQWTNRAFFARLEAEHRALQGLAVLTPVPNGLMYVQYSNHQPALAAMSDAAGNLSFLTGEGYQSLSPIILSTESGRFRIQLLSPPHTSTPWLSTAVQV